MGQKIARRVHDLHPYVSVGDTHMDVQAEDEVRARGLLQLFHNLVVPRVRGDGLCFPVGERVGTRRHDFEVHPIG